MMLNGKYIENEQYQVIVSFIDKLSYKQTNKSKIPNLQMLKILQ